MEIQLAVLNKEDEIYFQNEYNKLVLKKPSGFLIDLYYLNMITQLLFIRREYSYSIENQGATTKELNNYNPTYEKIILLIKAAIKSKSYEDLNKLFIFVNEFINTNKEYYSKQALNNLRLNNIIYKYDKVFSIKSIRNINEWFSFFVTYYGIA
jgi:hypothetical protein